MCPGGRCVRPIRSLVSNNRRPLACPADRLAQTQDRAFPFRGCSRYGSAGHVADNNRSPALSHRKRSSRRRGVCQTRGIRIVRPHCIPIDSDLIILPGTGVSRIAADLSVWPHAPGANQLWPRGSRAVANLDRARASQTAGRLCSFVHLSHSNGKSLTHET